MTEMSLVDIVSYPRDQSFVYSAIFKGGERVYFGRSSKHPRFSHGTTVSVRDLFYKFPVRQRYWSEATVSKLDHVLENVKRAVESLAIITPRVSFTVIDMAKDSKLMSYRKAESLLNRVTSVFGQSMSSSLTFVKSYDDDSYSFTGYISTVGHYNRLFQYIFLNNRPISDERLNRAILQLFQQSSFSKDSVNYEDLKRSRERHPVYVLTLKCSPKLYDICVDPTKMTVGFKDEDHVLFVVRETVISFLERHHFLSRSSAKTLKDQITTRKRKSRTKLPIGDTSRDMSLDHTSHVKSSRPLKTAKTVRKSTALKWDKTYNDVIDIEDDIEFELDEDWIASTLDDDHSSSEVEYIMNDRGLMLPGSTSSRKSLSHAVKSHLKPSDTRTSGIWAQDALRKWVNPIFPIPPNHIPALGRTDACLMAQERCHSGRSLAKSISHFFNMGVSDHGGFNIKNIRISKSSLQHAKVISQLDRKFILCSITLPLQVEEGIKSTSTTVLAVIDQHAADERVRVERLMKEMCLCNPSSASIGQESSSGWEEHSTHQIDATTLIPPIPISLSKREWILASQYSEWLDRWGIAVRRGTRPNEDDRDQSQLLTESSGDCSIINMVHVSHHFSGNGVDSGSNDVDTLEPISINQQGPRIVLDPITRSTTGTKHIQRSDYFKGWVTSLPRVIADRCVIDTTLTQDLIKDSLSWAEENKFSSLRSETESAEISEEKFSWLRCIRGCPRGILDIVNSKACRGAIMFNDELSVPECRDIVQSLAECSFPFQCAHGRPSVVPITVLAQIPFDSSTRSDRNQEPFKKRNKQLQYLMSRTNPQSNGETGSESNRYGGNDKWNNWMRNKN